jgi:hypothetical protein
MFMSNLGRVNHLTTCIGVESEDLRTCMTQWLAEYITADGIALSLTRWVKALKVVGTVGTDSD